MRAHQRSFGLAAARPNSHWASDLTSDSITDVSGDGLAVVNNRVFYEEETWTVESADGERRG